MWPGCAPFLGDPSLRGRVERHAGETGSIVLRSPTRWGARCMIIEVSHSQACPIWSCTIVGSTTCGRAPQQPVGRREQATGRSRCAIALAGLENRLLSRYDIAAVTVQEHDAAKSMRDQVVDQVSQKVEICSRRRRQGSGEIEVMVRVAQPQEGRPDDAIAQRLGRAADDFAEQHAVGEDRQMPAMLLHGRDGHDHGQSFATAATAGQLSSSSRTGPTLIPGFRRHGMHRCDRR